MRILILCAYFEPEIAASLYLINNLIDDLTKRGHQVDVYTPMPSRGTDETTREKYKKIPLEILNNGNLKIHRIAIPREKQNTLLRFFRYIYMNIIMLIIALKEKPDIVFLSSTPPTQGLLGTILKKIKKIPFIYNLQDVFPDSLVNTGLASNKSFLYKIGRSMEDFIYRNADKIIVISEDFKHNIMAKGVPKEKIEVVYNWVDENAVVPIDRKENILIDRYNLNPQNFYITYCGNIGFTQNMDMLVEVAKELNEYTEINFIIIGDGAYKVQLEKLILENNIRNIILLPFQPYEDIAHVFSLGDVGLIISKANIGQNSVPSKTWSIMSAGRVVLASFDMDSELCEIVKKAECGICVSAEDKDLLKKAILELYNNRQQTKLYGENGRKYILNNLTRVSGTGKYIEIIEKFESC